MFFRRLSVLPLLLLIAVLSGCLGASKKAHEAADKAMYQPVEYQNAATAGPEVALLPCEVKTLNATFLQKCGENNLRDFAEIELTKANFKVLENADKQAGYQEIAVACNLGDASALKVFKKKAMPTAKCFLTFDIVKAEPVAFEAKGGDGQVLGALIELGVLIATKGDDSGLGRSIGAAVSSVKSYEEKATWNVTLRYKVINAATGEVVATNELTEVHEAVSELKGALGVDQKQTQNVTLDMLTQRLIQRAVQEIDSTHKNAMIEVAAQKEDKKAKPVNEKALTKDYQKRVQEWVTNKDKEAALDAMRAQNYAFANIDIEGFKAVCCDTIQEDIAKKTTDFFGIPSKNPNWRKALKIDVSKLEYEMKDYTPEKCSVAVKGNADFVYSNKTNSVPQDATYDLVKTEKGWKVCSFIWGTSDVKKANESGNAPEKKS